jgi:hypothetical protein
VTEHRAWAALDNGEVLRGTGMIVASSQVRPVHVHVRGGGVVPFGSRVLRFCPAFVY